jgi:Protein of unknown function (DUF3500)
MDYHPLAYDDLAMTTPEHGAASAMRATAHALASSLTSEQREAAMVPFADMTRTRWTYMPLPRPGASLLQLSLHARKAAHRLLATALSRHAFAQAVTIMAFEEVLDLDEAGQMGRHSDNYYVLLFGDPADEVWGWRFEGHHLSVTATVADSRAVVAPLFLGSNPARVEHDGYTVIGPVQREEEWARAIITGMPGALRSEAIIADAAPHDIITGTDHRIPQRLEPAGIPAARLDGATRDLLGRLVHAYLDRLTPALAQYEHDRLDAGAVTFGWAGGLRPGDGHYYRLQAGDLLIEYDNTQRSANHVHTVLRRPGADFGEQLLPRHLATEHR